MRTNPLSYPVIIVIFVAMFALAGQAFAGGGMEGVPDFGGSIQGPEVWATVVLTCNADEIGTVSLRAKQIEDCNVETQAVMGPISETGATWACPQTANEVVNQYLPRLTLFGKPGPVITKAKNFKVDVTVDVEIISFDAQIKYWVPYAAQ